MRMFFDSGAPRKWKNLGKLRGIILSLSRVTASTATWLAHVS